jgi:hypothetical protein
MVKLLRRELIDFPGNGPLYDLEAIVIDLRAMPNRKTLK